MRGFSVFPFGFFRLPTLEFFRHPPFQGFQALLVRPSRFGSGLDQVRIASVQQHIYAHMCIGLGFAGCQVSCQVARFLARLPGVDLGLTYTYLATFLSIKTG